MRFSGFYYAGCNLKHFKVRSKRFWVLVGTVPEADELPETHMGVCIGTTVYSATMMVVTGTSFQSCSSIWCCTAAKLLGDSSGTGEE